MGATGRKKACAGRRAVKVTVPERPLKPSQCGVWMRRTLADNFPDVVREFLEKMPAESCGHLKLVTELLKQPEKKRRRRTTSVGDLLKRLQKDEGDGGR